VSAVDGHPGALRIVAVGIATTLQDRGRIGWAHLGVPTAGPVDRATRALVNRLVGNRDDALAVETAGGLVVEAVRPVVVAASATRAVVSMGVGEQLRVDPDPEQRWAYLAVRGGIVAPLVLGSASQDTLAGVGPAAVRTGDVLAHGDDPGTPVTTDQAPARPAAATVRLFPGPDGDERSVDAVVLRRWTVQPASSRVGVRLTTTGAGIEATPASAASEPLVLGAIQLTPSGEIIVMLADHPTTGGYPVVAVVHPDDLGVVGQRVPGSTVTFASAGMPGRPPERDVGGLA
jgi:biotin-dependent carboxylase-like uncharacterized protein